MALSTERSGKYKLPGEHIYDGMLLFGGLCVDALEKVKTMDLTGDVVVATYPKTGEHQHFFLK